MDESWDADFDGDLRVPETVRVASDSVKSETQAARSLSQVTTQLKSMLLTKSSEIPKPLLTSAMAIVQASTTDKDDEIYSSRAWKLCQDDNLEVAGDSIEEVLRQASIINEQLEKLFQP